MTSLDYMTPEEVAKLTGRCAESIRRHYRTKRLPGRKDPIDGRLRFLRSDVLRTYGLDGPSGGGDVAAVRAKSQATGGAA